MQVTGANQVSINSFQSYGSADATITISEPFDGSRTISYYYDEIGVTKSGSKTITCTANQSDAVYPEGVTAGTTANTFTVDYGTTLTVTATPDSIHYLATLGGAAMGSNTAVTTPVVMTAPVELEATFALKPTLTLAHNDGGTLEAIAPQGEPVLLTTVTATGETSSSQSPDGIVTVTLNNISDYSDNFGWLEDGTVTVEAAQGYTITLCVFRQNDKDPLVDDLAPFTATMESYSVYAETSTGQVYGVNMDGITSIEVYGYASADSIRAIVADTTYAVVPGANVTVKATPDSAHYLVNWDNDAAIYSNTDTTKHYVVNGNVTHERRPGYPLGDPRRDHGELLAQRVRRCDGCRLPADQGRYHRLCQQWCLLHSV